jgi:molybdopterin-guanine dinucleotide biosynthesis protein A
MNEGHIVGAVLAGGRGRRIGGDKAALDLGGRSLASYPVAALQTAGLDVTLVLREDQAPPDDLESLTAVHDEVEGAGPLGGLHAVLQSMPGEWALVVSCDQPLIRASLLQRLMSRGRDSDADVILARVDDRLHPMPGLYRKTCLPAVQLALDGGELALRDLLKGLRVNELGGEELDSLDPEHASFLNVNTPKDLANVRRLVETL